MARRKKGPKLGAWKYTVGDLTAYERADRGGAIYWRYWTERGYQGRKALCGPIRGDDGLVVPALEVAAEQAAIAREAAVRAGHAEEDVPTGPLTLSAGLSLLRSKDGKYVGRSKHRGDVERRSETIERVLGRDLLWDEIRHRHYRTLWRRMAEEHRDRALHGVRAAELTVGLLQTAARWLQTEGYIEPGTALPAPKWAEQLRDEWQKIVGRPIDPTARPRYTVAEQAKLWAALPKADPRIALAVEIGAELRLGQVPRSRRSDVVAHHGFRIGAVRVHGEGKKRGALVALSMPQRHALTRALTSGYLSDLERAYRAGELADYYLITGGKLRNGKAQVRHAGSLWGETGMHKAWRSLEKMAGVKYVKGRGWYGLRRLAADLAEDVEGDARVLNTLGGWTHTATRERYQEQGRLDIADRAKTARSKIRPKARRTKDLQSDSGEVR